MSLLILQADTASIMAQLSQEILKVPATPGYCIDQHFTSFKEIFGNKFMWTGPDFFAAQCDPAWDETMGDWINSNFVSHDIWNIND